jgi:short-subunit dehydrogenase
VRRRAPFPGVAVVTGASAGVGRATAVELARQGCDVALLARGSAGLEAAAREVEMCGRRAVVLPTDVACYDEVADAANAAAATLGPIDVWCNVAMTTVFAPVADTAPDDFARAVEVTFLGQVWGTKVALAHMTPRDRGTIVNVGSALAYLGIPLQAAYCASKFACRGFFQSVRAELLHADSAIRVHMVELPAVNTPQFDWCATTLDRQPRPVAPVYKPETAARAIVRAARGSKVNRILGVWNRGVVVAASIAPNVAVHFAARSAVDGQITDEPIQRPRPVNLRAPVDDDRDYGAEGRFGSEAHGMFDPQFVKSAPSTIRSLVGAIADATADRLHRER